MKRKALLKYLRKHGCFLKREGASHSLWSNPNTGEVEAVPRHTEIADRLAAADPEPGTDLAAEVVAPAEGDVQSELLVEQDLPYRPDSVAAQQPQPDHQHPGDRAAPKGDFQRRTYAFGRRLRGTRGTRSVRRSARPGRS